MQPNIIFILTLCSLALADYEADFQTAEEYAPRNFEAEEEAFEDSAPRFFEETEETAEDSAPRGFEEAEEAAEDSAARGFEEAEEELTDAVVRRIKPQNSLLPPKMRPTRRPTVMLPSRVTKCCRGPKFIIKNSFGGMVLDGSNYQVFARPQIKNKISQIWCLKQLGTATYSILNCLTGRALTLIEQENSPYKPIVTERNRESFNQRWTFDISGIQADRNYRQKKYLILSYHNKNGEVLAKPLSTFKPSEGLKLQKVVSYSPRTL